MTNAAPTESRRSWPTMKLVALIDFATASHGGAIAVLILISLFAFLPGIFEVPPIDRDEPLFAQITKQMVESGDYVDMRFQNQAFYKKPAGINWLQAGVVNTAMAFGFPRALTTIWLYRIPSVIGAVGAVLLTYWSALAFVSRRSAVLAGLMLAVSILLGVEARLARTDTMLLLTTTAALGSMARVYLGEIRVPGSEAKNWILPAIFWTALAGGALLKGPIIIIFVALAVATLVILDRSARWLIALKPIAGVAWFVVLVLPWVVAIITRTGMTFFSESMGHDMLGKVATGQESHGAPPGYYLLMFVVAFWPGSILAGLAAPHVYSVRREPPIRFLLAWLVPAWIVFEAIITKLPHYVLPLYPAIAILVAGCVDRDYLSRQRWLLRITIFWFLIPVIICVVVIGGLIAVNGDFGLITLPLTAAALLFGFFAWRRYETDGPERTLLRAAAAYIIGSFALFAVIMPALKPLFPSATLARILSEADCVDPVAAATGFNEPSLVFLLGTRTELTDGAGAADFLRGGGCRFAIVEARDEGQFTERANTIGLHYVRGPQIDAVNISHGRRISISVFRPGEQ
jgi:4-amino-4-deoxy-L-arabinose transferase-like glycosyltransferase